LAPATFESLPRRRLTIWSALTSRSFLGLRATKTRPVLVVPPPPTEPETALTAGSALTMVTNSRSRPFMAWNEMDWSAWMAPMMRPVSCWGKKPLGTKM